jgi:hypothetical protein
VRSYLDGTADCVHIHSGTAALIAALIDRVFGEKAERQRAA